MALPSSKRGGIAASLYVSPFHTFLQKVKRKPLVGGANDPLSLDQISPEIPEDMTSQNGGSFGAR